MPDARPSRKKQPTPSSMAIGLRIKSQRLTLGLSQAELAQRIGVSVNAVTQYETGRSSPGRERISKLLETLGKSLEWLMTGVEPPEVVIARTAQEQAILLEARRLPLERQDILLKIIRSLKE